MGTLHLVMSPLGLSSCLLRAGRGDAVLLMEDGVFGRVPSLIEASMLPSFFVLEAHRQRRESPGVDGVQSIDMVGFVRLTELHPLVVRWS